MAFDSGQRLTRELIAADPDAALQHIEALTQQANSSEELVAELRNQLQASALGGPRQPEADGDGEGDANTARERLEQLASENESFRRQLLDGDAQRSSLITGQDAALQAYREMVLQREPALPPELIRGGNLAEMNGSIAQARTLVAHVQQALQSANESSRLPAGAPMRNFELDTSAMSAQEKLAYGVRMARGDEMMTG